MDENLELMVHNVHTIEYITYRAVSGESELECVSLDVGQKDPYSSLKE